MKATRANLLGEFTGKLDGLIYYRSRRTGKLYVRRQWSFKQPHPAHPQFRSAQRAIFALQPSQVYINNFRDYLGQYNLLRESEYKPAHAWTNLYIRMMFALQKANPETVNLASITRQQIAEQNLPCRSLAQAVQAGLLPAVRGYERYSAEM